MAETIKETNIFDNFIFNYQNTYFDVGLNKEDVLKYIKKLQMYDKNNNEYALDVTNYEKLISIYALYKEDKDIMNEFNALAENIKNVYINKLQLIKRNSLKREE